MCSSDLEEALGTARVLLSYPPEQCKSDPRARAWIASLENLLDYAHHCHAPVSSAPTNTHAAAAPAPAPPEEERRGDPHGKRPMDPTRETVNQSFNPRRRSREEMEARADPNPSATVLDLYHLEQGPEEPLRRYIWRFWGVIVRIPTAGPRGKRSTASEARGPG